MVNLNSEYPTPLECLYYWENKSPDYNYLHQPYADGQLEVFSWARTLKEVRSMAAFLQAFKLAPGSKIAIMSSNCAHWLMADYAIWMAGHVSVPIYPTLGRNEVKYILEHSESKIFFAGKMEHWATIKPGVPLHIPSIAFPHNTDSKILQWKTIVNETDPLQGTPNRELDELATIIYTSGSTGTPKGVMISFRNIAMSEKAGESLLNLTPQDRMISYLPLSHVAERRLVEAGSLTNGFQIYFAHSLETFIEDLQRARPTLFFSVPRLWMKFQMGVFEKVPQEKLDKLLKIPILSYFIKKKILKGLGLDAAINAGSGAAPISKNLLEWYKKLGLEIIEGYGMTENFAYSHTNEPGNIKIGSVGIDNPLVETKIGENGEILIKSPSNMVGYYKDPQKTKEAFTSDGFLRTGDMGSIDEQGRLSIIGRVKEQFKTTKGEYIAPAPIEEKILGHHQIEMACVVGAGMIQPICLLNLSEHGQAEFFRDSKTVLDDLSLFLEKVNQGLLSHEKISKFIVVKENWQPENGFLTPTLKIKRHVVEKYYAGQFDSWFKLKEKVVVA
ncbi:MAG: AMP-binding protein [SAR324 cluster bacterium]|nr:AMP-binding protein [SAR324 cluster bacterium]